MPPFLQFRMWLRESPVAERALAAGAALIALALVAVALIPVATDDDEDGAPVVATETAGGQVAAQDPTATGGEGGPLASVAAGAAPAPGTAAARRGTARPATESGTPAGPGSVATAPACDGLAASGPGVTAKDLLIDISTISLAGPIGNSQFDIRGDLHEIATALAAEVNRTGGVACGRKLLIKIYDVNPLDTNDTQAKCLQMVQDNPYLVMDFGGYLGQATRACFVQNKLPIISSLAFDSTEAEASFPYVVGPRNLAEDQARQGILGLADRGFFARPQFRKLGVFGDNCLPTVGREIDRRLAQIGIRPEDVSRFTLDCNPAAAANQIAQAVLKHKGDNVSHVFMASSSNNGQNYTRIAASQVFRPIYGISDYGEGLTPSGARNWDPSFAGAMGITATHVGETVSGMRNANVDRCDQIMKRHGVAGFSSEAEDLALLAFCDLFDFFRGAVDKAGKNPVRTSFATGVAAIGEYKTAYAGDANFNRPGKIHGGDFQRAARYDGGCACWKVHDGFEPAHPA